MKRNKFLIPLTKLQSDEIRKFWDSANSGIGSAMLAQPIFRENCYSLRLAMFSPEEAERAASLIDSLK